MWHIIVGLQWNPKIFFHWLNRWLSDCFKLKLMQRLAVLFLSLVVFKAQLWQIQHCVARSKSQSVTMSFAQLACSTFWETCAGFTWEICCSPHLGEKRSLDEGSNHCCAVSVLKIRPPRRNHYISYFLWFWKLWEEVSKRAKLTSQQNRQHAKDRHTAPSSKHTQLTNTRG